MSKLIDEQHYLSFLGDIKQKIRTAQIKANITVNQQLLQLYWDIGTAILLRQREEGWGAKVIQQLAKDLRKAFPDLRGFSKRNLLYMRQFAVAYPDFTNVQVSLAHLSWYHNITLLQKCKDETERVWYAQKTLENGWSRDVMVLQIESNLRQRQGNAISNFTRTLPQPESDLAQQMLKDPYLFDFLNLREDALERELEDALVKNVTDFLLELGVGFAFVGRQYQLSINEREYRIDLLFYHIKLRCYVAVDLKVGAFVPEYAGKMNFYLSALDDLVKEEADNSSIGIIICKTNDRIIAEYALRNIHNPIGVSEFQLTAALPKDFASKLPSIEAIEKELDDTTSF